MENELNEVEIRLKDMFFYTLYRWRVILVVALVLALLLGGLKFIPALAGSGASQGIQPEEDFGAAKEQYQKIIQLNQDRLDELEAYCANSILMNLDSFHVYRITCRYYVDVIGDLDYQSYNLRSAALRAYEQVLGRTESYESLARKYTCDARYLRELVTTSLESENILKITVAQENQELASELADLVVTQLENAQSSIRDSVCEHSLHAISRSGEYLIDENLAKTQTQIFTRSESYNKEIAAASEALAALPASGGASSSGVVSALKSSIKSGILGFLLGGCGTFLVCCVAFWMSDKLYSAAALTGHCKYAALLTIPKQKSDLSPVDRLISKLEERAVMGDDGAALLTSAVRSHCAGKGKVLVTGDFDPTLQKYSTAVQDALKEDLLLCKGSLLRDAAVMDKLSQCDSVLLIESCGKSLYRNISTEIALAQNMGKQVIGCIVVD